MDSSMPASIVCIIATEFCERFSFCGLRTILSLYLRNELRLSENSATTVYHVFIMICYILPILGAICADSGLGRYRTIFYFSVIYLVGNMIMVFAAIPATDFSPISLTVIGLTLISVGTGGSKPCLAAFGGDQFRLPQQREQLQQFFSLFYFSINLGGFVGMIITPIMRKSVTCFGDDTCYALGFGFPALLILLSILIFMMGKHWYRMKSPKENVVLQFVKCTFYGLYKSFKRKDDRKHWLDHARDKFEMKLVTDMKIVFAVLLLYTPLPLFWSLFDQQGSRWTFQASRMNDKFLGIQILPDQMILYPYLGKMQFLENPLHRMAVGGIIAGLAFLSAGILELILQLNYPPLPGRHKAATNFINTLPCDVVVYSPFAPVLSLNSSGRHVFGDIVAHGSTIYNVTIDAESTTCGDIQLTKQVYELSVLAVESQTDSILIGINKWNEISDYITDPVDYRVSLNERPRVRIDFITASDMLNNISVSLKSMSGLVDTYYLGLTPEHLSVSQYIELPNGAYECVVSSNEIPILEKKYTHLALGGVYALVIRERNGKIEFTNLYTILPPNSVSIMWLVPQYFLISVAEIMFGIAGLEFSFTQAPKSMKTVTVAAWYLSVAFGNLIVIMVTELNLFKNQAFEFFFFGILIVADMMIFTQMAAHYKFVQLEADSSVVMVEDTPLLSQASMLQAKPSYK
ncbi:hypothetical protein Trydic_g2792 [Trypoxylus dichotomus]